MQRSLWYNFKDCLMRSLSRMAHWPHSSGSRGSNWGRTMGSEERGELSLPHTDKARLPAFPLQLCTGRVPSPGEWSCYSTTTQRLSPGGRLARALCFMGSRFDFAALRLGVVAFSISSWSLSHARQTQTHKPKPHF